MNQAEFDKRTRTETKIYSAGRTESAAFLIWYLSNFFRLEDEDAIAAVCDGPNDKGIDGIYVDEDEEEVHLFQSKFSPEYARDQGDNDIRNFMGAKQWFNSANTVDSLLQSTASKELKALVRATSVFDRILSGYPVRTHFLTNKVFNTDAKEFLNINKNELTGHDLTSIFNEYTYVVDSDVKTGSTALTLSNPSKIEYDSLDGIPTRIYAIPAKELIRLNGIQDKTLFYRNVRYGLGRTRVNRDIKETIEQATQHKKFFLYHNGITIVCDALEETGKTLTLTNYSVINGCQSMLALYERRDQLTSDMYVLAKVIQVDPTSQLIGEITHCTNNQNPIRIQDLKGDDRAQKAIQSQFKELFDNRIFYRRKRGESSPINAEVIEIDLAAQLMEAFYLGNPQNTHLKARLFGERYSDVFSRHTNAAKIYLAYLAYQAVRENVSKLRNIQVQSYGLAHFFFIHLIAEVLRTDHLGKIIMDNPIDFVKSHASRLKAALIKQWIMLCADIDLYIQEYTASHDNFFDYKNVFKSSEFVTSATSWLEAANRKYLTRHTEDAFEAIYGSIPD